MKALKISAAYLVLAFVAIPLPLSVMSVGAAHAKYTCADVRQFRAEIIALSKEQRREWIEALGLSKKQVRQVRSCLRHRD